MKFKAAIIIFIILFATNIFASNDYLGGTFFGANGTSDSVNFVEIASNGDVYISGTIGELNLTNVEGFDTTFDSSSETLLYIAKFDKDLKELKAFTYIGNEYSHPMDFKIGKNGDVYILTTTLDLGLPDSITGYDTAFTRSGRMLIRLSSDLKNIKNYTYLVNVSDIETFDFDQNGDIILAGYKYIYEDTEIYKIFVGIMTSDLSQLKSSYVYGKNDNKKKMATSIFVDRDGYIYLAGYSNSIDFPEDTIALSGETYEEHEPKMFISKFNPNLQLIKTSYIANGSPGSLKVFTGDNNDNLFLSFRTDSSIFKPNNESENFYPIILKIDTDLTKIEKYFYTDYYPKGDYIFSLKCDNDGNLYAAGSTVNNGNFLNFPFTEGAWRPENSSHSVGMLLVLDNDLSELKYATIIGGFYGSDRIYDIDITPDKIIYTGGNAQATNFPVGDNGYQSSIATGIGGDGFVVRFAPFEVNTSSVQLTVGVSGSHVNMSWTGGNQYSGYMLYYAPYPYTTPDTIRSVDLGNITSLEFDLWQGAAFYIAIRPYISPNNFGDFSNIEIINVD